MEGERTVRRPIGVMILAGAAGLAGLYQLYQMLVYLSVLDFNVLGKSVSYPDAQWGAAFWALLIALIWFWVAAGFWNLRAYAVQFGIFISLFTLIWGFFALLFGSTYEAQTIPWFLALVIFLYLSYPGVQKPFVENELSKLTPEQKAAMEQLQAANAKAASGASATQTAAVAAHTAGDAPGMKPPTQP
jgi:hypothetical protein